MIGTHFGRYFIKRKLGKGGMASVYLASDHTGRDVALKILPPHFLHDPTFRQRFLQEAQIIAKLEHHAIVPVYDYGEHQGQPYITMRLMTGGSLKERLASGALPLGDTLQIVQGICAALSKAHANHIVHRDLKPANILFDADGKAYLADFGIARLVKGTQTGTLAGTFAYMAPEQAQGKPLDARTDVYQMGILCFEMLTGRLPFEGDTPALIHQHAYAPIPSIRSIDASLSPHCEGVITRAMAKKPADRFASANELAEAFALAVKKEGARRETKILPSPIQEKQPSWLMGTLAVLIVTVVGLVGLIIFSFVPPPATPRAGGLTITSTPIVISTSTETATSTQTATTIPTATSTETATAPPTPTPTPTAPPTPSPIQLPEPFGAETYGVFLVVASDLDDAQTFTARTESSLKSVFVETGLVNDMEIASLSVVEASDSIETMTDALAAKVGALILLSQEENSYSIITQPYFPDVAGRYVDSLEATTDALLQPFEQTSLVEGSSTLADRLGATVNAAIGYDAMRDGEYEECTRRFIALLSLVGRTEIDFSRAEATYASLAICQNALGKAEEARANYEQALAINPDYALAHFGLGNYWYTKRDYEQATLYYEETIRKSEIDPYASDDVVARAYGSLGNIALANLEFEKAIEAYTQAIEQDAEFPGYYLARANAKIEAGLLDEGRADLAQCIELASGVEDVQSAYYKQIEEDCSARLGALDGQR